MSGDRDRLARLFRALSEPWCPEYREWKALTHGIEKEAPFLFQVRDLDEVPEGGNSPGSCALIAAFRSAILDHNETGRDAAAEINI